MNATRATSLVQQWVVVVDAQGARRLVAQWVRDDAEPAADSLAA